MGLGLFNRMMVVLASVAAVSACGAGSPFAGSVPKDFDALEYDVCAALQGSSEEIRETMPSPGTLKIGDETEYREGNVNLQRWVQCGVEILDSGVEDDPYFGVSVRREADGAAFGNSGMEFFGKGSRFGCDLEYAESADWRMADAVAICSDDLYVKASFSGSTYSPEVPFESSPGEFALQLVEHVLEDLVRG